MSSIDIYPAFDTPRTGFKAVRRFPDKVTDTSLKFGVVFAALDVLALCLAAWIASFVTVSVELHILHTPAYYEFPDVVETRQNIYIVLCMVVLAMLWAKGLYNQRMPWWSQVQYIGKVVLLAFLLDGFINFALKLYEPRLLILSNWMFACCFLVGMRWIGFAIAGQFDWWKTPTVIIGDNATATDIVYAFNADPCAGYNVHTIFLRDRALNEFEVDNLPRQCRNIKIYNGLLDYERYIRNHPGNFYVICLAAFREESRDALVSLLDEVNSPYAVVPPVTGVGLYQMEPRYFFGHDIMMLQSRTAGCRNSAATGMKMIKRMMDIAISGTALLFLMPLFAIVSTMLKFEGQGGSIFYGGKRIGYKGRPFSCWKFRSMEPDSDHLLQAYLDADPEARENWERYRKLSNDPRITTRTARFIRKASIDELPQLWNVLVGDMNLVGPRPILEDEKSYFGDTLKEYMSVQPGLTGLWQVSGRNETSFMRRVHWDRWYVRNWSLWGDIVILIKTPLVLLTGKGAN